MLCPRLWNSSTPVKGLGGFRPWRTRTSGRPWRRASTLNRQSPGPGSPRWTCCCCCCCAPPYGWAATDKGRAGPAGPSCAGASAASTAAGAPPCSGLHGSRSDGYGHLEQKGRGGEKRKKVVSRGYLPLHADWFIYTEQNQHKLNYKPGLRRMSIHVCVPLCQCLAGGR